MDLLWQLGGAGDGELRGLYRGVLAGLCAANRDGVLTGDDDAIALFVDLTERARVDGDANLRRLAGIEVHAGESSKDAQWSFEGPWLREVEFDDLVADRGACILHCGFDRCRLSRFHWRRRLHLAVREGGVTEAVAESVERLAFEVAIGAALHRVVLEGGQLAEGCVEGEWKASCGIVVAGERFGDCGTAFFAWIPCFEDGLGILGGPVDRERAAVLQDDDER